MSAARSQRAGVEGGSRPPPNCRAVFGNSAGSDPRPGIFYPVLPHCCPNARQLPPSGQIKPYGPAGFPPAAARAMISSSRRTLPTGQRSRGDGLCPAVVARLSGDLADAQSLPGKVFQHEEISCRQHRHILWDLRQRMWGCAFLCRRIVHF